MFRKLLYLALLLGAAMPAFAQQGGKTLLVMRELDDGLRSATALRQALQMKKAGVEVRLLFESEAVLIFLQPRRGQPLPPPPEHLFEEDGRLLTRKEADERARKGEAFYTPYKGQLQTAEMAANAKKNDRKKTRMVSVRKDPRRVKNDSDVLYKRGWWSPGGGEDIHDYGDVDALALAEKALPYEICSYSAEVFGVYEELKSAGRPLTPDRDAPADLAAYLKEGYEIYVY
jgi:hypothetical protein